MILPLAGKNFTTRARSLLVNAAKWLSGKDSFKAYKLQVVIPGDRKDCGESTSRFIDPIDIYNSENLTNFCQF